MEAEVTCFAIAGKKCSSRSLVKVNLVSWKFDGSLRAVLGLKPGTSAAGRATGVFKSSKRNSL